MRTSTKPSGNLPPVIIAVAVCLVFLFARAVTVVAQEAPPADFKIAFIGDQALGPNAAAVLNLIKLEGAQAVMHSGDLDYVDNPSAWEAQINSVLGANFPYFVSIGNHDELAWSGPDGYQQVDAFSAAPVGDLWEINCWMAQHQHHQFEQWQTAQQCGETR